MKKTNHQALKGAVPPSAPYPLPRHESTTLQERLAAKDRWKSQSGHRYTPEELEKMSAAAEVKIQRRKRVVMRY